MRRTEAIVRTVGALALTAQRTLSVRTAATISSNIPPVLATGHRTTDGPCFRRHTSMDIYTSLSDLVVEDGGLPSDHPYRRVVARRMDIPRSPSPSLGAAQASPGGAASRVPADGAHGVGAAPGGGGKALIDAAFKIHQPWSQAHVGRVPPGRQYYSLSAEMSSLDVVFLNRFQAEALGWLYGFLAMWGLARKGVSGPGLGDAAEAAPGANEEGDDAGMAERTSGAAGSAPEPMLLVVDLTVDAPVILVPCDASGADRMEIDLGRLSTSNRIGVVAGTGTLGGPRSVLVGP